MHMAGYIGPVASHLVPFSLVGRSPGGWSGAQGVGSVGNPGTHLTGGCMWQGVSSMAAGRGRPCLWAGSLIGGPGCLWGECSMGEPLPGPPFPVGIRNGESGRDPDRPGEGAWLPPGSPVWGRWGPCPDPGAFPSWAPPLVSWSRRLPQLRPACLSVCPSRLITHLPQSVSNSASPVQQPRTQALPLQFAEQPTWALPPARRVRAPGFPGQTRDTWPLTLTGWKAKGGRVSASGPGERPVRRVCRYEFPSFQTKVFVEVKCTRHEVNRSAVCDSVAFSTQCRAATTSV